MPFVVVLVAVGYPFAYSSNNCPNVLPYFYFFTWIPVLGYGILQEESAAKKFRRLLPKSHGSGKTFPGPRALKKISSVRIIPPTR